MSAPRLFAGLDVSTQSCKLVVIDLDASEVVHVDRVGYDDDLPHYGTVDGVIDGSAEGVSESDPRMWIEAVETVLERLTGSAVQQEHIRAIALSGQQHGLVALDADGELARERSKLWNDFSTAEECEILTDAVGGLEAMIAEVGNSQRPGYTAGKILHMKRHEPEAYERAASFLVVKDYVNWHLTGGKDGGVRALEPGDASGLALWNPATSAWSERVVEAIDPLLGEKLPAVGRSDRAIGLIGSALAARFGLSPDCVIAPGAGDNLCAAIGTGNVREGLVTVSLGTSGTACTYRTEPFTDPTGEIASFRDATGAHLPLLCVSNLANGYNDLLRLHGLSHETFNEMVDDTPPGNRGRLLIPWYAGERTPDVPHATPVYFGFDLASLEPAVLARALLEGHVLNLQAGFERMPISIDDVSEIRLTGGLSQSPAWRQAIADIFDAEVVPVLGEGAALGAAISAAWVWSIEHDEPLSMVGLTEAFVDLDEGARCRPRPEHSSTYRSQRELFAAVSRRLRGLEADDPFEIRGRLFS